MPDSEPLEGHAAEPLSDRQPNTYRVSAPAAVLEIPQMTIGACNGFQKSNLSHVNLLSVA
jgi:hypothetical protein